MRLSQEAYVNEIIQRFHMENSHSVSTPLNPGVKLTLDMKPGNDEERDHMRNYPYRSLVGSIMYAMICTRPDISTAVGKLTQYLNDPSLDHWKAAKRVIRYLKGTADFGVRFSGGNM